MRLNLILPKVEPNEFETPKKYPRKGCSGTRFVLRQQVSKKIVDQKQISKRVNGMAVMLYILGLSYGAVEIVSLEPVAALDFLSHLAG